MNSAKQRRPNHYLDHVSTRAGGELLRRLFAVPASALPAIVLFSGALLGCGGGGGGAKSTGQLLVTVQASVGSVNYRLQNATMTGAGAEAFTLDTDEATAAAVSMSRALAPGAYTLKLENGWAIEKQAAASFTAVAGAQLISPNPLSFNVAVAQVARVGFAFDAAGVSVDMQQVADEIDDNNE